MRSWAPSLIPDNGGHTFYLVIERFRGNAYFPETTLDRTEFEDVLNDLVGGQYDDPLEIVAFNPTEGWSKNVTEDIASELQRRADLTNEDLSPAVVDFIERHARRERQLALRLV